jgi:hypothetical protein
MAQSRAGNEAVERPGSGDSLPNLPLDVYPLEALAAAKVARRH